MNQHRIQKAYLKNFSVDGTLWEFDKHLEKYKKVSPSVCTIQENFQSEYLERLQNEKIERIGIKCIRNLCDKNCLTEREYEAIKY